MVARVPEKTNKFFTTVFNWKFNEVEPGKYWTISGAGISGGLTPFAQPEEPFEQSRMTNSIRVSDIDTFVQKIRAAGGKIIEPKKGEPENPNLKICEDPNGIRFGIYKA